MVVDTNMVSMNRHMVACATTGLVNRHMVGDTNMVSMNRHMVADTTTGAMNRVPTNVMDMTVVGVSNMNTMETHVC